MRALLSVWDKTGLIELATGLAALGVELVASGGTAAALRDAGIAHLEVADVTGFPEMLDGRVKTLHPRLHAGILADRSKPAHLAALAAHDITAIDLVVSNLYPFSSDPSIELIDIGGPSMVRAAAKNHEYVGVLTSPQPVRLRYSRRSSATGTLSDATRHALARAAFAHTAAYDAQIVAWMDRGGAVGDAPSDVDAVVPPTLHLTLERASVVRYGENPHQIGARYRVAGTTPWWDGVTQHAGSALSYLNLFDADAAWRSGARAGRSTRRVCAPWPSSSTPTLRAPRSVPRSPTPSKRRSRRTPRAPSGGSSPWAANSTRAWRR